MVVSNQIPEAEAVAYHATACAFAMQKAVEYIEEDQRSKGREFIAVRTKYGVKQLDAGKRAVFMNATGA
jgi:hypothetical protein